jgi:uncharacterized protein (DUF305 family)
MDGKEPINRRHARLGARHQLTAIGAASLLIAVACTTTPQSRSERPAPVGATAITDTVPRADADTRFIGQMIVHHDQALRMTRFVPRRTYRDDIRQLAERMDVSQRDEIARMQRWLATRGLEPPPTDTSAHHASALHVAGMLTADEMRRLEAAEEVDFERLFLELMIRHHEGALAMVQELLAARRGGGADIFQIATDIDADQRAEIERMRAMLTKVTAERDSIVTANAQFANDPRVGLRVGITDAGVAARNMVLVANRPRPPSFVNPDTLPDFDFASSDLAFRGNYVFQGSYHGFQIWDISDPANPTIRLAYVCPGGQGDVSVFRNLLFVSVQETRSRLDCGTHGVADSVSAERFRGVRIFDISNIAAPRQVAAVQACRGSHTHTLVSDPRDGSVVYVYVQGTNPPRPSAELVGCVSDTTGVDTSTAYFRIEVIRVPLAAPQEARIVNAPRLFADPRTGAVAGLWPGGAHGPGTQWTSRTRSCHDITVYPEYGLAAGACSGNGILLDISDPVRPLRIHEVVDPNFAFWHSATFSNDARTVVFTDEWGGGGGPRCRISDRREWGANALFRLENGRLRLAGYYKLPAPQADFENCVAHNGSLIPVPGRDIMVQGWYQGGVSVFDFTDPARPVEIAFFDRGPFDRDLATSGGHWSAYWYNGRIYGSEILRGLDVLQLAPSEHLSANEIAAAELVRMDQFNPQLQTKIKWQASFVVVRAYLDQLARNPATAAFARSVADELARAERATAGARRTAATRLAGRLERNARTSGDERRVRAAAEMLRRIGAP